MNDHLFPRYHVRPPTGYLNDPNGPVLLDGLLHLYFQYRGSFDQKTPTLWGHVTSRDFVRWDYHRPALIPHPILGDRDGCWSGNTVVDDTGRLRAFYSGRVTGEPLQRTLSAMSYDGGTSFGPPSEVVPAPPAGDGIATLRDPYVWRDGSSWRMVLGAGTSDEVAMLRIYSSDDLERWTYVGPLAQLERTRFAGWDSGAMWECPQIVRVDGVLLALFGSWAPVEGVMTVFSIAAPDTSRDSEIEPSALHVVDHGPNFYAPSVLADSSYGPVVWGWATEGRSADWWHDDGWSGMLTLPRVMTLRSDGGLASSPLPAMTALRTEQTGREVSDRLDGLEAQMEFGVEPLDGSESTCTLRLRFGANEVLEISIDYGVGSVSIDRTRASADTRADSDAFSVPLGLEHHDPSSTGGGIRGFVDGSILELFLPDGKVATTRFYPTTPPPWRLELDGTPSCARVRVWELTAAAAEHE